MLSLHMALAVDIIGAKFDRHGLMVTSYFMSIYQKKTKGCHVLGSHFITQDILMICISNKL